MFRSTDILFFFTFQAEVERRAESVSQTTDDDDRRGISQENREPTSAQVDGFDDKLSCPQPERFPQSSGRRLIHVGQLEHSAIKVEQKRKEQTRGILFVLRYRGQGDIHKLPRSKIGLF